MSWLLKEAIERQLGVSSFFNGTEGDGATNEKRKFTPLTNLGCESEFRTVDNDFRYTGGGTSLKTVSEKHVVSRNALFEKDRWNQLDEEQKRAKWKWASNRAGAKKVRQMEREFVERVGAIEKLALEGKREQKKKIHQKLMKNIEECKIHGGPLTHLNIAVV